VNGLARLVSSGFGFLADRGRRIHRKIPLRIRRRYVPVLYGCYHRLKDRALDVYFPPVTILHGKAIESGLPLAFAYAGTEETAREYWARMTLAPGFGRRSLGRCPSWRIGGRIQREHPECAFSLMEHTAPMLKSLSRRPGFRLPFWVDMELVLPNLHQGGWGRQRKDLARRIRKNDLGYEFSKDPADFDDFLRNMHLPYITKRYANAALIADARYLSRVFSRGALVLIKKGTDIVGGGLFEYFPGMIRMRKLGVRDGSWEYVRQGVIGAIYYFMMVEMEERGYEKIYLGGTRPLLSDGVTRFKSSLNARVVSRVEAAGPVALWLTILRDSPALRGYLVNNPFIYFPEPDKACRALFVRSDPHGWDERIAAALRASDCNGLMETTVFVLGETGSISQAVDALPGSTVSIRPADELFSVAENAGHGSAGPGHDHP
jgi:hypothetical protein